MDSAQSKSNDEKTTERNITCPFYVESFNFKSFYLVSLVNVGIGRYSKPTYFISNTLSQLIDERKKKILSGLFLSYDSDSSEFDSSSHNSASNKALDEESEKMKKSLKDNKMFMKRLTLAAKHYKTGEMISYDEIETELVETIKYFSKLANGVEIDLYSKSSEKKLKEIKKSELSLLENKETEEIEEEPNKQSNDSVSHGDEYYNNDISYSEEARDWNNEFFATLKKFHESRLGIIHLESLNVYDKLQKLLDDFGENAKSYAKLIIDEYPFPISKKTIKPIRVTPFVSVFTVSKVFIRLYHPKDDSATAAEWEEMSKKVAAEFKAVTRLRYCELLELRVPLTAVIDYKGIRVIVTSICPIDRSTLIDENDLPERIKREVESIQRKLNLRTHHLHNGKVEMLSSNVEFHRGHDGEYYITPVGPLFPDEDSSTAPFATLRPEFVRHYKYACGDDVKEHPLSTDTREGGLAEEPQIESQSCRGDVVIASNYLRTQHISEFSRMLLATEKGVRETQNMSVLFHEKGINMRHLGRVFLSLKQESDEATEELNYWCSRVLFNMTYRSIKFICREKMRSAFLHPKSAGDSLCRVVIINYFNALFGQNSASEWKEVEKVMAKKFAPFDYAVNHGVVPLTEGMTLLDELVLCSPFVGSQNGKCFLFERISKALCLEWDPKVFNSATTNPNFFNEKTSLPVSFPFIETDLVRLGLGVKDSNLKAQTTGLIYYMMSFLAKYKRMQTHLLETSAKYYTLSQAKNPDDKYCLRSLGNCYTILHKFKKAEAAYERARQADPEDPITLFNIGQNLNLQERLDDAEAFYLAAIANLEVDYKSPKSKKNLFSLLCLAYADFLAFDRRLVDDAEKFYKLSMEFANLPSAHNNYAIFLAVIKRDFVCAEKHFLKSICAQTKIQFHFSAFLNNYITFLLLSSNDTYQYFGIDTESDKKRLTAI